MEIIKTIISNDNTKKYYFSVSAPIHAHVEACLLNLSQYGYIICVSSQVGCSQKCRFCASGRSKFIRNLSSEEIQKQVELIVEDNIQLVNCGFQITYMGSGEPLSNYRNVFESIDNLRKKFSSLCRVNISTTCPTHAKKCFEDIDWKKYCDFLHFQYSLHFTQDKQRYRYLCTNLMEISVAIEYLNRISGLLNDIYKINYIPFDGLNDDEFCVKELRSVMKTTQNAILKISKMCEINGCELFPSKSFELFAIQAQKTINNVEIFSSDGTDVSAGCGQFYNESLL